MPTRYTLYSEKQDIEEYLETRFLEPEQYNPSYNIAPATHMPVARVDHSGKRVITSYRWGLPEPGTDRYASDDENGESDLIPHINKEDFEDSSYLMGLLQKKRCIIPANGFYEWKKLTDNQEPFYLRLLNKELTAFAGLYDNIIDENGEKSHAYMILNVAANAMVKPLSDHMPAMLGAESHDLWLNRSVEDSEVLLEALQPTVIYEMATLRVPELVNDTEKDSPELIQPIPK